MTEPNPADLASRIAKRRERKRREADFVFRQMATQLPRDVMMAILCSIRDNSAAPLRGLPEPYAARCLAAFRESTAAKAAKPTADVVAFRAKPA